MNFGGPGYRVKGPGYYVALSYMILAAVLIFIVLVNSLVQ